jgi:hypothetical protein
MSGARALLFELSDGFTHPPSLRSLSVRAGFMVHREPTMQSDKVHLLFRNRAKRDDAWSEPLLDAVCVGRHAQAALHFASNEVHHHRLSDVVEVVAKGHDIGTDALSKCVDALPTKHATIGACRGGCPILRASPHGVHHVVHVKELEVPEGHVLKAQAEVCAQLSRCFHGRRPVPLNAFIDTSPDQRHVGPLTKQVVQHGKQHRGILASRDRHQNRRMAAIEVELLPEFFPDLLSDGAVEMTSAVPATGIALMDDGGRCASVATRYVEGTLHARPSGAP